jgi:copper homeostasis protein
MVLEVIALSATDVMIAQRCGADRIELVTGIAEGGLTPSLGLIEEAIAAATIPVNVMIRPHSRSFCYNDEDVAVMLRDIEMIRRTGASGIVIGALTPEGKVDVTTLEKLLQAAGELDITFHRAFDAAHDQLEALELLARYPRIGRILTSGGQAPAPQAIPRLRALNVASASRKPISGPRIMAGHGLTPETLELLLRETGVEEVHFGSAIHEDRTFGSPISVAKMGQIRRIIDAVG